MPDRDTYHIPSIRESRRGSVGFQTKPPTHVDIFFFTKFVYKIHILKLQRT